MSRLVAPVLMLVLSLASAGFASPDGASSSGPGVDASVREVVKKLDQGDYLEAFRLATAAIKASPDSYQPYYYAGVAMFRVGSVDEAEKYVLEAKKRASSDAIAIVEQALALIDRRKQAVALVREADDLLDGGQKAAAADRLLQSWRLSAAMEPSAAKAARLYSEVDDWLHAAIAANAVVAAGKNEPSIADARSLLAENTAAIDSSVEEACRRAASLAAAGRLTDAVDILRDVTRASPARTASYLQMARTLALSQATDQVVETLASATKSGTVSIDEITSHAEYDPLWDSQVFGQWVHGAFGVERARGAEADARLRRARAISDPEDRARALREVIEQFPETSSGLSARRQADALQATLQEAEKLHGAYEAGRTKLEGRIAELEGVIQRIESAIAGFRNRSSRTTTYSNTLSEIWNRGGKARKLMGAARDSATHGDWRDAYDRLSDACEPLFDLQCALEQRVVKMQGTFGVWSKEDSGDKDLADQVLGDLKPEAKILRKLGYPKIERP